MNLEEFDNSRGCSCHTHPPCSFCLSLTEEENNILWNEGMDALRSFIEQNETSLKENEN